MVRLMLVLAPVMCILSGVAVSSLLSNYMKDIDSKKMTEKKSKKSAENESELRSQVYVYIKLFLNQLSEKFQIFLQKLLFNIILGSYIFCHWYERNAYLICISLCLGYI